MNVRSQFTVLMYTGPPTLCWGPGVDLILCPPPIHDWVIKGFGMSATGHIKYPVPLIKKTRASCPGGRFPPSRIHQVIVITRLNKLWLQARSQGGVGGVVRPPPPPVAHPKDFVPPFSNFVPPFSNFVQLPPFSNFVPPFSNFVPPFSNFVPPLEYVDDVTRAMSKGGDACECPRVGAFFKLMTSRGQCPRGGGCAWCSTHPSSDPPPHLAGWLRACDCMLSAWRLP